MTVRFGGLTALFGVSLSVQGGEVVGVIGPNGAGKTTLFNVVCGYTRPSAGRILVDGRELARHHPFDLPGLGVARTLQGTGLIHGLTVLENVMAGAGVRSRAGVASSLLGLRRSSRDERQLQSVALQALARVGVEDVAGRLPATLPYAVAKRVALARALAAAPRLLLLDEPAGGLSHAERDDLRTLLGTLRSEMGVLLVEHDVELVMGTCDRIVVLDFGRVIAEGPPETVRADPAVAEAYLGHELSAAAGVDGDARG